jgi:hypothetical protein
MLHDDGLLAARAEPPESEHRCLIDLHQASRRVCQTNNFPRGQSRVRRIREKSPKTVNNILSVLNVLLKTAHEWEVIDRPGRGADNTRTSAVREGIGGGGSRAELGKAEGRSRSAWLRCRHRPSESEGYGGGGSRTLSAVIS